MRLYTLLLFASIVRNVIAGQQNRTIDDVNGDSATGAKVQYLPTTFADAGGRVWKSSSSCNGCAITPDSSKAFDNTWTSATYFGEIASMSAGFSFQGTAIYIYLIQSNYPTSTGLVSSTTCNFKIDGQVVGNYQHDTDGSYNFQYNVLAFSSTSLSDGQHSFLIETTGDTSVYVIFDYAIYTTNVQDTSPATTSNNNNPSTPQPVTPSTNANSPSNSPSSSTTSLNSVSTPASKSNSSSTSASLSSSHPISASTSRPPTSSSSSSSSSNSSSNSPSTPSNELAAAKKKSHIGSIVGGVIAGILVIVLILLALLLCRRRRHTQIAPFVDGGQASGQHAGGGKSVANLTEGTSGPPMADLQHQITERQHVMNELEQRGELLNQTGDGSDVRQQMEEMQEQIRALVAQQQMRGSANGDGSSNPSNPLNPPNPGSNPELPPSTYTESSNDSQSRLLPTRKHDHSAPRRNRPPPSQPPQPPYPSHAELLIHSDSGLRMNSHSGMLELPPSYVEA